MTTYRNANSRRGPLRHIPIYGNWSRITDKWRCQFRLIDGQLGCRWNAAKPPTARQLMRMIETYSRVRDEFVRELETRLGIRIICLGLLRSVNLR